MLTRHTVHRECPLFAHTGCGKVRVTGWTLRSRDRGRLSSLTHAHTVARKLTRRFFSLSLFLLHSLTALVLMALFSTTRFLCMYFVVVSITLWWGSKSFFSGDVLREYPSGDKSRSAISVGSISGCNSSMNYIHRYKLTDQTLLNWTGICKRRGSKLKKLIFYGNDPTTWVVAVLYRLT